MSPSKSTEPARQMRAVNSPPGGRTGLLVAVFAALVVGVVATIGGLVPAHAARFPTPTTTPGFGASVAATADSAGDQFVVWRGQDTRLWYVIYSRSSSQWGLPEVVPGSRALGSAPTVAIDQHGPQRHLWVLWRDDDGRLWSAGGEIGGSVTAMSVIRWEGTARVAGAGNLASQPAATYVDFGSASGLWVFWKEPDGGLASEKATVGVTGLTWSHRPTTIPGMGPLGSQPAAGSDAAGRIYVYWQGAGVNTSLWEEWYDGAVWSNAPISLAFTQQTGSAPSVAVTPSGQQYIYWQGIDHNLWFAEWTGSKWLNNGANFIGDGPLNSQPAATFSPGSLNVFWEGTDLNLWTASSPAPELRWSKATPLGDGPL